MIELRGISMQAGTFAMSGINLCVERGGHAVLMGPTGAGKTSLLELICGLLPAKNGTIHLAGRDVTTQPPWQRGVGYVPQDNALFDHLSVRENLAYALRRQATPESEVHAIIEPIAEQLSIRPIIDRMPLGLSGGETKRVSLGRALAAQPSILLLDEPLTGLDEAMAATIRPLLHSSTLQQELTVLHVTHDKQAAADADQCFELNEGRIIERSPPKD